MGRGSSCVAMLALFALLPGVASSVPRVTSVDDCPGGAEGGWQYYGGRCYIRGGRGSYADCNFDICPRLANATRGSKASSTLACVYDGALNDFLAGAVGGVSKEPGSWVGLYQDPGSRKKARKGWTMQANGCGSEYASWFAPWKEPNHHFGCVESCAVMGIREEVGNDWADVSCRADRGRKRVIVQRRFNVFSKHRPRGEHGTPWGRPDER